jgi:hypothetical protein
MISRHVTDRALARVFFSFYKKSISEEENSQKVSIRKWHTGSNSSHVKQLKFRVAMNIYRLCGSDVESTL